MARLGGRFSARATFDTVHLMRYNFKLHTTHSELIKVLSTQSNTIKSLEATNVELMERLKVLEGISAQMASELDRLRKDNWKLGSQVESLEGWESVARTLQKERELEVVPQAKRGGMGPRVASSARVGSSRPRSMK
jgi:hypothetical protein